MKKLFCALLAMTLLLMSVSALSETITLKEDFEKIDVTIEVPEGAQTETEVLNEGELSALHATFADGSKPGYHLFVAYDEVFEDRSLANLSEEEMKDFYDYATVGFEAPSFETRDTDSGVRLMILNEDGDSDYAYVLTVIDGYFISIYINYEDFSALAPEDLEMGVAMLSSVVVTKN